MATPGATSQLPPRVSRAARVAHELETEILTQVHQPGERLGTKEDLRERFGVAVATLSEALRLLETRGLTEARPGPGGGIFVTHAEARVTTAHSVFGLHSDPTTFRHCLAVRDALEPLICRHAAYNRRATDVRALEAIVADMARHMDDPKVYFAHNWELHRRLATLTPNMPLRMMYLTITDYLASSLDHAVYHEFDGAANVVIHRELIAAIAAGPGERLDAAIAAHAPMAPLD
jgi:DNA-binding FadR family transcriptional regulator